MDLAPTGDLIADTAVTRVSETSADRLESVADDAAGYCYDTVIRDGYGAGTGVPNGGLVLAILARAMADTAQRPSLLTVTGQYLRRTRPGPATVVTQLLRNRRLTMTQARLEQDGVVAVHASAVFADRADLSGASYIDMTPPDLPDPDDCLSVDDLPDTGANWPPIFYRLEHRLPADHVGFATGSPSGRAVVAGWCRPWIGTADEAVVPFLLDALFPSIFNIGMLGFVPTVELTVQLRRPPGDGWLRHRFATRAIGGGIMDEDGELWTADGHLIALSRQTALPSTQASGRSK